jgi:phosphoribosylanthranilate isomerase
MSLIKICGITDIETALATAEAGADLLGLVLATSRRKLAPEQSRKICDAVRALGTPPKLVGVFVNLPAAEVNQLAADTGLDYVQLSGDEDWNYCKEIKCPLIKAVHISEGTTATGIINEIAEGYRVLGENGFIPLLDTKTGQAYGGTGVTFDWELAKAVAVRHNIIVAGGLNPENVGELVRQVKPWGVDVSSGVETEGRKDIAKIRKFIETVRKQDVT